MINLPVYNSYNNETQIALLDNSSISFMEQMHQKGFAPETVLGAYDAIFVPGWVIEEADCSASRSQYLNDLYASGLPLYRVEEKNYIDFADDNELQMYRIVYASVSELSELRGYIRRNVTPVDMIDLEEYATWITQMYDNWPIQGRIMDNGKPKRKNAGEISLTVLAEVLAWNKSQVKELTIYSQDADTRAFQTAARASLIKEFARIPAVTVTYKSNDCVLCQLFREGALTIEEVKQLRKDEKWVCFTHKKQDASIALEEKVLDNDAFATVISDPTAQIVF